MRFQIEMPKGNKCIVVNTTERRSLYVRDILMSVDGVAHANVISDYEIHAWPGNMFSRVDVSATIAATLSDLE